MGGLQSWFDNLVGDWLLAREISTGEAFNGAATFSKRDNNRLLLAETGALTLVGGTLVPAMRQWVWSLSGDELLVEFAEEPPRPYHRIRLLPLNSEWHGKADHLCIDDTYDGEYFVSANAMKISQKVSGPKKDYTITSKFTRNHSK